MKKTLITLAILFVSILAWGQLITTTPAFITQDGGAIDIVFDATYGTGGLKDYTGDVYAHAGVITTDSKSGSDWKHAPVWGDNSPKYKLLSLGNNKWKLSISPNMTSYFGLTTAEKVTKLVFVFRSGVKVNGNYLEGKDVGGTDIFVNVYQSGGINISITNPASNQAVAVGTVMNIGIVTSVTVTELNLFINGIVVKTANASSTMNYTYTFATSGDYTLIAKATLNGQTVYDTVQICVPEPVTNQIRPQGMKDGINYNDNTTVTLILHAPYKSNVFVIGDFNNWTQLNAYQMKKDGDYWWITLSGLTAGKLYGFQYLVNGTQKVTDPYTELLLDPWNDQWINQYFNIYPNMPLFPTGKTEGVVSTFQTNKSSYNWEVSSFTPVSFENLVIYEILLRDFTVEKSFEAAISKLDYLKNLGITAIELMPVQEFDGNNSWGYNPNHFFAVDKAYGSSDMLKKFVDEAHKRGIAVILDMVFNHASGLSPFAALYWDAVNNRPAVNNPWMNPVAPHPYSVYNDFNHSSVYTREYFKRVLKYWLSEYKVDGYRMDLTKGFTQTVSTEATASNYDQSRIDILTDYYNAAKDQKPNVMFILEHFCSSSEETILANKGMYLWRNVNNAYSQAAMGYQTSSEFTSMLTNPRQWVGYAESHDEERNFYKAKTWGSSFISTDSIARIKRVPLNIAFSVLLPGPKMMWQFEEMGYDYSIDSNGGRTNGKPSAWSWLNLTHRKEAVDETTKIINLRRLYPNAFTNGVFDTQITASNWNNGRRVSFTHSDLNMVMLGNFTTNTVTAYPNFSKTGTWYNIFTNEALNISNTAMTITLQSGDLLIYTDRIIDFSAGVKNNSDNDQLSVYPTVTNGKLHINSPDWINRVSVYSLQGQLLRNEKNITEIDLSTLSNGIYLVEVNSSNKHLISKVIKN